ncbi:DUF1189 family protein [Candidatus Woesearchaeota archaeon]|nr:DUF1189 family protein [Candidatus Woesearchaeota archaeon]
MDLERFMGKYLSMFVSSYNPNNYERMIHERHREFVKFFIKTLGIGMVIFLFTFMAVTMNYIGNIPQKLDTVERFEFGGVIKTNQSVMIVADPDIVLDLEKNDSETSHEVVITKHGVIYPKYLFFGKTLVPWSDLKNLKQQTPARDHMLYGIVLFLLPSILVWFFVLSIVKIFLLLGFMLLAGYYLPRIFSYRILFTHVTKIALLTMPSVVVIGMGFHPIGSELFWWGAFLTLTFFTLGIALLSEKVIRASRGFSKQKRSRRKA